jgi:NAD/NADP transhydrogenase beta subunit
MNYLVAVLYMVAFSMFIYGLMGLTGPKTAVRGNWIAAAGMAVAVIATLIVIRHTESWGLIVAGLLVGSPKRNSTRSPTETRAVMTRRMASMAGPCSIAAWSVVSSSTRFESKVA